MWDELRTVSSFSVGISPSLVEQVLDSWYISHPHLGGTHEKNFIDNELIPVMHKVHSQQLQPILDGIRHSPRQLAVDGTFQNRNNNSEWGSAVVQDVATHYIISIHNMNIEDTPNKQAQGIEVPASIAALTTLVDNGIQIAELTTDGKTDLESTIHADPKLSHIHIQHDAWHKARNMRNSWVEFVVRATKCDRHDKKPEKTAKMLLRKELLDITNPFIWHWRQSCANCGGNLLLLIRFFLAFYHHKICISLSFFLFDLILTMYR